MTSAPSCSQVRVSPLDNVPGFRPPGFISSKHPAEPGSVPDTVPLPNRSPACRLHPFEVWCATICATVQYKSLALERDITCGAVPDERIFGVSNNTSKSMLKQPVAWSAGSFRCGSGAGSPAGRGGCAMRNGAKASVVMIHGDTNVDRLFARNGPRGCDSQLWTSRADQSFSRQKPAVWLDASAIGIGVPSSLPGPTHTPSSSS